MPSASAPQIVFKTLVYLRNFKVRFYLRLVPTTFIPVHLSNSLYDEIFYWYTAIEKCDLGNRSSANFKRKPCVSILSFLFFLSRLRGNFLVSVSREKFNSWDIFRKFKLLAYVKSKKGRSLREIFVRIIRNFVQRSFQLLYFWNNHIFVV